MQLKVKRFFKSSQVPSNICAFTISLQTNPKNSHHQIYTCGWLWQWGWTRASHRFIKLRFLKPQWKYQYVGDRCNLCTLGTHDNNEAYFIHWLHRVQSQSQKFQNTLEQKKDIYMYIHMYISIYSVIGSSLVGRVD
jgi:hypothetical protein